MEGHVRLTYVVDSATFGGAEQTVVQLLEHLPRDIVTSLVATRPVPPRLAAAALARGDLVEVGSVRDGAARAATLSRAVCATSPDVVHANLVDPASNVGALLASASSTAPSVATVHMVGRIEGRAEAAALAAAYRRVDRVLAVSSEISQLLMTGLGVPGERVEVVTNGVPVVSTGTRGRERRALDRQGTAIGGVGRLTHQKGWDVLLDAVRILVATGTEVSVEIIGEGRERERLEKLAAGIPVSFPGYRDDVGPFLDGIDVFCLPSRAEGLPLALLEAMMAGLPAVATAVGAIPEEAGDIVALVPPDDAPALSRCLRAFCSDAGLRRRLGRAAAGQARARFDVSATAGHVTSVYRALAGGDFAAERCSEGTTSR